MATPVTIHKGIYYYRFCLDAIEAAEQAGWPTDRIVSYGRGWAIQMRRSGPYMGPENKGKGAEPC